MPRVNNNISLSIVHGARTEKNEDKKLIGNRKLSLFTAELDYARNSSHESDKGISSGRTSGYLDQAWKWLRIAYNGGSSVANSGNGNEEGTELQEILAEGGKLHQQAWSLSNHINEKPIASAWKGCFFKRCLVGVGILTGGGAIGSLGYGYYAGRQSSTTGPERNATRPAPCGRSVKPGWVGMLNETFAFPEVILAPDVEIINAYEKTEPPERSVRHLPELPALNSINNNHEVHNHDFYELFDDVKIDKNDYLCAENRESLTFADVLRVIASSLGNPFEKGQEEWLVFSKYHLQNKGCPTESDLPTYNSIFHELIKFIQDQLLNLPQFIPLRVMQKMVPFIMNAIADYLEGKETSKDDLNKMTEEATNMAQLIISSMDFKTKNNAFNDPQESINLSKLFKLKNNKVYIPRNQKEYRVMLDSKGPYILQLNENLELKKIWGKYSSDKTTWRQSDSAPYFSPNPANDKRNIGISSSLLKHSRKIASKNKYSASSFVGKVLRESHIINKEVANEIVSKMSDSLPPSEYLDEVKEILSQADLINSQPSRLILFTEKNNPNSIQHTMLSIGNGLFSGADHNIISDEEFHSSIITAEQMGEFGEEGFVSNNGKVFSIYSGAVKGNYLSTINPHEAIGKLEHEHYELDTSGAYAVAEIMSNLGGVTSEFVSLLRERLKNKASIDNFIKYEESLINDIDNQVLPGDAIMISERESVSANNQIYGLRINNEEFFIPSLHDKKQSGNAHLAITNISTIKEKIKLGNYFVRKVKFESHNARVNLLLGKDALFYENMGVLTVRGHGLPMTINYMSTYEMANIIKGLAINKGIDLDKITMINLNSCFGANGFPSTGRTLSSLLNKKVAAYSGRYSESLPNKESFSVTYEPSPLKNLEELVAGVTEKNIDFIVKVRNVFFDLKINNVSNVPSTSSRNKRDLNYFNVFLLDLGALIMHQLDLRLFITRYKESFSYSKDSEKIISDDILKNLPDNSIDFFYSFMDVLYLSPEAISGVNDYLDSKKINTEGDIYFDNVNKRTITENDYIYPRKWNEDGYSKDVYLNDEKYQFFILKKSGMPSRHDWQYPLDCQDNDHWIYAGSHPGTRGQPKNWYEYGKAGTIYYEDRYGYFMLKADGLPADHNWYFPFNGESNNIWEFITWKAGTYETPYSFNDTGKKGDVYFEKDHYYILKSDGCPSSNNWNYPSNYHDNEHWFYSGLQKGSLEQPMAWRDYGKSGSVYYKKDFGYFKLINDGRPSDNEWHYPDYIKSNNAWYFLCFDVGSFVRPKLEHVEGVAGEVYYSIKNKSYYILRRDGKPSVHNWSFPENKESNKHWIYAGENEGTLEKPKHWNEYGKAGSIYYEQGYGYYQLNKEGNPSERYWFFPHNGTSNAIWAFIPRSIIEGDPISHK